MKRLCEREIMKSLIKNIYGYYVIHKLAELVKYKHNQPVDLILKGIFDTIQYATDKSLHTKW